MSDSTSSTSQPAHGPMGDAPAGANDVAGLHARVIAQVMTLVAAEPDPARRARLIARGAAAIGQGAVALYAFDSAAGQLLPLAIIPASGAGAAFDGAASGVTVSPEWAPIPAQLSVSGYAARNHERIIAHPLAADTRFSAADIAAETELFGCQPEAILCLPVADHDRVLGALTIAQSAPAPGFPPHAVECAKALAGLAALTLTAQAYEHERHTAQARLIQAQEDERRRIGRDLHDGPVQSIASAAMTVELIDGYLDRNPAEARIELRRVYTSLNQAIRDLRSALFDLRPPALATTGLKVALRHLVAHFQEHAGLPITLSVKLPHRPTLDVESTIYLIVREALNNVLKHAQATACAVEVSDSAGQGAVRVVIRDNGVGFDAEAIRAHYPRGQSWGLLNMYERARAANGQFAIHSRLGQGTTVELIIPNGEGAQP